MWSEGSRGWGLHIKVAGMLARPLRDLIPPMVLNKMTSFEVEDRIKIDGKSKYQTEMVLLGSETRGLHKT